MLCTKPLAAHNAISQKAPSMKLKIQQRSIEPTAPSVTISRPPSQSPRLPLIAWPTPYAASAAAVSQPSCCLE